MWEFALLFENDKKIVAKQLFHKFKEFSDSYENIVSYHEKENFISIITSCSDLEKYRYKAFLEELIVETICEDYKRVFLLENLKLHSCDDVANEAFIQALLYFDRETDSYIVAKYLQIDNQINLDGFFNFKLKKLRDKWLELVSIANENQTYLYSDDTFVELIKFLVDNIEFKSDVVNIVEQDEKYIIVNEEFEEIDLEKTSEQQDKKLISSLISLCPKSINIYCSDILPQNVTKLICSLFEKRVKFRTKVN